MIRRYCDSNNSIILRRCFKRNRERKQVNPQPPSRFKGKKLKIYYVTQGTDRKTPQHFVVFVNDKNLNAVPCFFGQHDIFIIPIILENSD